MLLSLKVISRNAYVIVALFLPHGHGTHVSCQVALDGVWPLFKPISFILYEPTSVSHMIMTMIPSLEMLKEFPF